MKFKKHLVTEATIKQRVEAAIGKKFTFGDKYEVVGYNDKPKTHPVRAKRINRKPHTEENFTLQTAGIK